MSIGESSNPAPSLPSELSPRAIPDILAQSHADAWRAIRANALGLSARRTIAFACELPAFAAFAAAAFVSWRLFTHADASGGAAQPDAAPVAGASIAVVVALAAGGALLWIAAHVARGAFTAFALDALRGERRVLGPWLRRRWPALVGWGAIELAAVIGLALLAAGGLFGVYWVLAAVWGLFLPGPDTAPSLADAAAQPPWLLTGVLSALSSLVGATAIGALAVAVGYVWYGLRLVPWRLADDAASLRTALGDSWRSIRGRRRAWWAMSVGWSAAMPFLLMLPVVGWYAGSLLGWTWSGAFYDRVAAPATADMASTYDEAAALGGAAVGSPRRGWAWVDNSLLGLQAAITLALPTTVIVVVTGTIHAITAAKRSAWVPNVNMLLFILIAVSGAVAFAASLGLVTMFLRRTVAWPAVSGWSRSHVYSGLVGLAVVLSLGRGVSATANALNGVAVWVGYDNDARWVAEALPDGFQAPTHAYADEQLEPMVHALDRKTESIPFAAIDTNGDRFVFAYVIFKTSDDAAGDLSDLARTANAEVAAGRARYAQGEWAHELAQVGHVVIVAAAPDKQAERLGDAMDALAGRVRSRVGGGAGGE